MIVLCTFVPPTHISIATLFMYTLFVLVAFTSSLVATALVALQAQLQKCRDEMQARDKDGQQEWIRRVLRVKGLVGEDKEGREGRACSRAGCT